MLNKSESFPDAGEMRQWVAVQSLPDTPVPDGQGGTVDTWTTILTTYCKIKPLRGQELFNARQLKASVTHQIIFWQAGVAIDPSMRLVDLIAGTIFNIDAVLSRDAMNAYYDIWASERVGAR